MADATPNARSDAATASTVSSFTRGLFSYGRIEPTARITTSIVHPSFTRKVSYLSSFTVCLRSVGQSERISGRFFGMTSACTKCRKSLRIDWLTPPARGNRVTPSTDPFPAPEHSPMAPATDATEPAFGDDLTVHPPDRPRRRRRHLGDRPGRRRTASSALVFAGHAGDPAWELGDSRISKLRVQQAGRPCAVVFHFDRGLDVPAQDTAARAVVDSSPRGWPTTSSGEAETLFRHEGRRGGWPRRLTTAAEPTPEIDMTTNKQTTKRPTKKPATAKKLGLDAAARVLAESGGSMTTKELIDAMAAKKLWASPAGKTPAAHPLLSFVAGEIGSKGKSARFKKGGARPVRRHRHDRQGSEDRRREEVGSKTENGEASEGHEGSEPEGHGTDSASGGHPNPPPNLPRPEPPADLTPTTAPLDRTTNPVEAANAGETVLLPTPGPTGR